MAGGAAEQTTEQMLRAELEVAESELSRARVEFAECDAARVSAQAQVAAARATAQLCIAEVRRMRGFNRQALDGPPGPWDLTTEGAS